MLNAQGGKTALFIASLRGHVEVVTLLLEKEAAAEPTVWIVPCRLSFDATVHMFYSIMSLTVPSTCYETSGHK